MDAGLKRDCSRPPLRPRVLPRGRNGNQRGALFSLTD
jgi:hypothetical protein